MTIVTAFTPYPGGLFPQPPAQPKSLVFHLPPGLAGDPFATPRCTEEQFRAAGCPPETQVGQVAVEATTVLLGVPTPTTAAGGVFNLVPAGAEPARLGAVIQPATPGASPLLVPTEIQVRATDGGLDSVIPGLPRQATVAGAPVDVHTEKLTVTLFGRPPAATGPFMRNPTSCKPATATVEAVSYDGDAATPETSAFTPTDCGALPFEPHLTRRSAPAARPRRARARPCAPSSRRPPARPARPRWP